MLPTLLATALCLTSVYTLRGGFTSIGRFISLAAFDPSALVLGVVAVTVAVVFYGPMYGVALILSIMLHEFGHVAAYRICGHADARFRLIPMFGGVAISNQMPASHEKAFFISLLGPGICLAPMVLASAVLELNLVGSSPAAEFLWILASVTGAINFFNLLPFWPLDGGRCMTILFHTFLPRATNQAMMAMAAATIVLALFSQSMAFLFFALMATQNLLQRGDVSFVQRPMSRCRGARAAAAYSATLSAFALNGRPLLARFF